MGRSGSCRFLLFVQCDELGLRSGPERVGTGQQILAAVAQGAGEGQQVPGVPGRG
ncbi:MAG: hypothetical protein ACRDTE_18135 [Pseudonocardiaceae bacterium]